MRPRTGVRFQGGGHRRSLTMSRMEVVPSDWTKVSTGSCALSFDTVEPRARGLGFELSPEEPQKRYSDWPKRHWRVRRKWALTFWITY